MNNNNKGKKRMENYIEKRAREATWKLYEDDKEVMGSWIMGRGFAISIWKLNHPEEMQGFREEYKKSEKSA